MSENSGIEWTDHTFNPWWGCEKVSPGCAHCYAETWAKRFGVGWGQHAERRFFGDRHWADLAKWNRAAERDGVRRKVFVASMGDVCEVLPDDHPDVEKMAEARKLIKYFVQSCPWLIFQFLTKRPENFHLLEIDWEHTPNAWAGVTVENQEQAIRRVPLLMRIPASVRFVSCEPLLESVNLMPWLPSSDGFVASPEGPVHVRDGGAAIDWVIVGGESGRGARTCWTKWIQRIVDQCVLVRVPAFVKQVGSKVVEDCNPPQDSYTLPANHTQAQEEQFVADLGRYLENIRYLETEDSKGGDMHEWPESLRVRQFPVVAS